MATLHFDTVKFVIDSQSQKTEWSDERQINLPGRVAYDSDGNPLVEAAIRGYHLELVDAQNALQRISASVDVEKGKHGDFTVKAKAWLHTISPEYYYAYHFKGYVEALVVAVMVE
jgi:hypothetical protein